MNYSYRTQDKKKSALALSIAVGLHLLLIYALINGLGRRMIDVVRGPMETKIIVETKPPVTPPPPVQPRLVTPPPPFIPVPVVEITPPTEPTHAITAPPTAAPPAPAAFTPPTPWVPAPAVADTDVSEVPIGGGAPVYPEQMQDAGRAGSALVECQVGTDGKTSDCVLLSSKGGDAFGQSALNFARSEVYRPATHNGVAVVKRRRWQLNFSTN